VTTRRTTRRTAAATLAAAALAAAPACTGLEPALIGPAVTGASQGAALFSDHEIVVFEHARFDDVVAAAELALSELGTTEINRRDDQTDRRWYFHRYGDNQKLVVEIIRETPVITRIGAEVKSKRQRGMAALFLRKMHVDLAESGSLIDDAGRLELAMPDVYAE